MLRKKDLGHDRFTIIARKLTLKKEGDKYIIASTPVKELEKYVGETITKWKVTDEDHAIMDTNELDLTKAQVSFLMLIFVRSSWRFSMFQ